MSLNSLMTQPSTKTVVLVDAMCSCYAINAMVGHLATKAGEPTGLRFGMLRVLLNLEKIFTPDKLVVVWDAITPVKASGVSEYKANRVMTDGTKKMYGQLDQLKQMLALTKYSQAFAEGYEADDVIGSLSRQLKKEAKVVIVSTDNDFCQLIEDDHIVVWDPRTKALREQQYVIDTFGRLPREMLFYRAVMGDVSDNLPGLKLSVGEKVALTSLFGVHLPATLLGPEFIATFLQLFQKHVKMLSAEEINRVCSNVKVMALVDPPEIELTKGKSDERALAMELDKIECSSFMKVNKDGTTKVGQLTKWSST